MSGLGFGPGNIDCDDVLDELYQYMDEETDEDTRGRIRQHLEACAPCLRQYGLENDVRALIARCCGGDQAPASLHERIRVRITELTIETGHVEYRAE
ncbi:MAG TPA: mycothiol system anti-sigma-R factor [Jatrophihabitans sp.]|jgi:mycothiol system anti-sigma-R factor